MKRNHPNPDTELYGAVDRHLFDDAREDREELPRAVTCENGPIPGRDGRGYVRFTSPNDYERRLRQLEDEDARVFDRRGW